MAQHLDPAQLVRDINNNFNDMRQNVRSDIAEIRQDVDNLIGQAAAREMGPGSSANQPEDPEYTRNFQAWFRRGQRESEVQDANATGERAKIRAAMSEGSDPDGGYMAPIEWDRMVWQKQLTFSAMRRLANVVGTSNRGYSTLWNERGTTSGWVGETAARPETNTPTVQQITFTHGEIYANPAATQLFLEDTELSGEEFILGQIAEEFALQESQAFIDGDGVNKPNGLLTYAVGGSNAASHPAGAIDTPTMTGTTTVTSDELTDFVYGLESPYRRNAAWLMNSATAAIISKIKDADGNQLWRESLQDGQPPRLLGYPVEIDEFLPDMAASGLPIVFGDFQRGYVINDRLGMSVLRDPYTNKPYVNFYARKRVGAGLTDPHALRIMQMAAS